MSTENCLDFWRAIEALTAQDLVRLEPNDSFAPVYGVANNAQACLPWQVDAHNNKPLLDGRVWRYDAQCGVYCESAVSNLVIARVDGRHLREEEAARGSARLFDLSFDQKGFPIAQSFALSLAAWSAGQVLRGGVESLRNGGMSNVLGLPRPEHSIASVGSGFAAFDELSKALVQWVIDEVVTQKQSQTPANVGWLKRLVDLVVTRTCLPKEVLDPHTAAHVRAVQVKTETLMSDVQGNVSTNAHAAADILSSFYIEDLLRIKEACQTGDVGDGFKQLMGMAEGGGQQPRIDVRSEESNGFIVDALAPARMPPGRWPSDHALVFSQQLAVNETWGLLANKAGLCAVNGPPGTGKTTLLRDVVATVVTQRAEKLVQCQTPFESKQARRIGDTWVPYYPLHASLRGHSIVVTSANNGAVENISRELPGAGAVPERAAVKSDYFKDIAAKVAGKDAWGLLAAPLGNKKNRNEFLRQFWWSKSDEHAANHTSGMRELLKEIQCGNALPYMGWQRAVQRFNAAAAAERSIRNRLEQASKRPEQVATLTSRLADISARSNIAHSQLSAGHAELDAVEKKLSSLEREFLTALKALGEWERRSQLHAQCKPGVLDWLTTFGRANRSWLERAQALQNESNALVYKWQAQDTARAVIVAERDASSAAVAALRGRVDSLEDELKTARQKLGASQRKLLSDTKALGGAWPDLSAENESRETLTPWATKDWMTAREELFLAALDVHRAFIEKHSREMLANLSLASDWLSGKPVPADLALGSLDSLCLVVPVISTTFASVPRMFSSIGREGLGWLLVDEGGQALTQHAAGAIWRAKRSVIVGDPLQLEPVYPMPASLEACLGGAFKVPQKWWPSYASAQAVADRSARVGTAILNESGDETWVGFPLRLHRRCDEPMFSISNRIAYAGLMVHGKAPDGDCDLPDSAWLDVRAEMSDGHWVGEEGIHVDRLLGELLSEHRVLPSQIALISPFRDCARRLRAIARAHGLDLGKAGTVHTAQGKEADIVILVLGGNPKTPGAKTWAAAKPNLLNVAVSRGRKRLYVVGNRLEWSKQRHFDVLAELVPAQTATKETGAT